MAKFKPGDRVICWESPHVLSFDRAAYNAIKPFFGERFIVLGEGHSWSRFFSIPDNYGEGVRLNYLNTNHQIFGNRNLPASSLRLLDPNFIKRQTNVKDMMYGKAARKNG